MARRSSAVEASCGFDRSFLARKRDAVVAVEGFGLLSEGGEYNEEAESEGEGGQVGPGLEAKLRGTTWGVGERVSGGCCGGDEVTAAPPRSLRTPFIVGGRARRRPNRRPSLRLCESKDAVVFKWTHLFGGAPDLNLP